MKETKTVHISFAFYDRANLERFLEEQAAEGWMFRGRKGGALEFYRIQPSKIHFSVVYYHTPVTKTALTADQAEFLEYCARTGWYLVDTEQRKMILSNKQENPIPIETDPKIQLDNIHKSLKKQYINLLITNIVLGILNILLFGLYLSRGIVYLSTAQNSSCLIMVATFNFAFSIPDIIGYYRWRNKAKIAAEDGFFYETQIDNRLCYIILFIAHCAVIAILTITLNYYLIGVIIAIAVLSVVSALGCWIWHIVRKPHPAILRQAFITHFCALQIIAYFLVLINLWFPAANLMDSTLAQESALPLSVTELTDTKFSDYVNRKYTNGTILLTQDEYRQEALNDSDLPELYYTITYVHADFLYEACQKDLLKDFARHGEAITVDASGWNAEAAYQLYAHGSIQNHYLLCYDGHFVEIQFDWEPTAEHMALVGQKLAGK